MFIASTGNGRVALFQIAGVMFQQENKTRQHLHCQISTINTGCHYALHCMFWKSIFLSLQSLFASLDLKKNYLIAVKENGCMHECRSNSQIIFQCLCLFFKMLEWMSRQLFPNTIVNLIIFQIWIWIWIFQSIGPQNDFANLRIYGANNISNSFNLRNL